MTTDLIASGPASLGLSSWLASRGSARHGCCERFAAAPTELAHDRFWRAKFSKMRQVAGGASKLVVGHAEPMLILAQVLASLADLYQGRVDEARAELDQAERALGAAAG